MKIIIKAISVRANKTLEKWAKNNKETELLELNPTIISEEIKSGRLKTLINKILSRKGFENILIDELFRKELKKKLKLSRNEINIKVEE